ncbi:SDR family NAD(P)-dependent oxidoreductase [Rubellimicrobium rubrum]|uniref:SDR family NAD(P)-dependent oxidoreductase n=1 Tax=Rubellimicrobium rubrum TaxID=2585369 RepID=A0A5C4MZ37_9RHOB|nr:type I polyketide synthase [Rubellimicrobium rubrum]TNC50405.1 SDR family NAD(P)-dependent oxidoreductase [Rubellimicrobium rubrum]
MQSAENRFVDVVDTDIAIVGLGLHLPGAASPDEFWSNLKHGRRSIRRLSRDELLQSGEAAHLIDRPDYVPFAADLPGFARFDAEFWGLSPKDAGIMDPQHRQFLEAAWEALENAGHMPETFKGRIGVFAGCGQGAYYHQNILTNRDLVDGTGLFLLRHTGNDKDFLATRLSHTLDLRGPSVNLQTACSTSLVATHYACQALLAGECDMALAGGVTIELPHARGYLFREGEILSPDGECHAFDHRAAGTVFGSGAGVAVLRRLSDAVADGDEIWAVIKGSAVNNDGASKAGYLAPSVDGQAAAVSEALLVAQVRAESIGYIECHGTGTYLGDPIEVAALTDAFRKTTDKVGFCRLGSVKTNIGHLDTAAGVASLAKVALALKHGEIPPSLGFEAPNPAIPFDGSPFRVADRLQPWPVEGTRRAAVNSLGVGGTNAHAILEEPPRRAPSEEAAFPFQVLTLSARNKAALDEASLRLASHLRAHPEQPLADVAWTLQVGRRAFDRRRVLVASSHEEAAAILEAGDPRRVFTHQVVGSSPDVVFMFPGGGAQYAGMAHDLYETEPVFQDWMDRGLEVLAPKLDYDPREIWLPAPGQEAWANQRLLTPSVQLPLIMIVEYALAQLWISWGVKPAVLIGHSMGENTAACLAGVLSFEDCIGLVHLRGTLFDSVPAGGMLSVGLPASDLRPYLQEFGLDLAAENAPRLSVASGPADALDALARRLDEQGIDAQRIPIAIAAHSRMLDGILTAFGDYLRSVPLQAPKIPMISNRTGTLLTPEQAVDPEYWVGHLRNSVLFAEGLSTLAAQRSARIYVEVGPGKALASLAGQHGKVTANQVLGTLRHQSDTVADDAYLQAMLARVWAAGGNFDWEQIWAGAKRQRVRLPTYPFQRSEYFIAPGVGAQPEVSGPPQRVADLADWGWAARWIPRYAACDVDVTGDLSETAQEGWLIFVDEAGLGADVAARLKKAGQAVTMVRPGDRFAKLPSGDYLLPPEQGREGYDRLLQDLSRDGRLPSRVLHLWLVTQGEGFRPGSSFFHRTQEQGFWSLLFLAQSWGEEAAAEPLHLITVTSGTMQVRSEPLLHPSKATVLGPVQVIPREFGGATSSLLDIDPGMEREALVLALIEEALAVPSNTIAALRAGRRLERSHRPAPLASAQPDLKAGRPVLITGGFGGIGLTLAQELVRKAGSPIVLVSRTPLPPRAEWDAILRREGGTTPARIRSVRSIEALGGRVLTLAADVANIEEMRAAVDEAQSILGPLSGIVHAAGVVDDAPILGKSAQAIEDVFAPKVHGTQVLDELFPDGSLDWMLLCSSTSTVTAPAGQVDYVAANAYLNAFARARSGGRTRVTALDWGVWHGVGMAAEAMAARTGRAEPEPEPVDLPLLDRMGFDVEGSRLFTAKWIPRTTWVLNEHRTRAGDAVLPGTGVLELVAEAMQGQGEEGPYEIRDLTFLRPLRAPEAGIDVRLTLRRTPSGYDMRVESAAGRGDRELNAEGRIELLGLSAPGMLDPTAIRTRLDERDTMLVPAAAGSLASPQERHLAFGSRWRVLREGQLGRGEGLARLTLPPAGAEGMIMHPGLLDLATGWAMALIPDYEPANLWVPLSYGSVRVFGPLPSELLSHVRLTSGGPEIAQFDVTLAGPDGTVCVEVEGFTMRRLDAELAFGVAAAVPSKDGPRPLSPAEERLAHAIRQGIRPEEGAEAFLRVLALGPSEIVVSSMPLPDLIAQASAVDEASTSRGFERPASAGDFVAPEGEVETRLAAFWTDLLGVSQVGAGDSFFDLGGHSLIAVRLFAQIKKTFGVEFPISVLFEAPTIRACARLIEERGGIVAQPSGPTSSEAAPARPVRRFTHLVPMHQGEGGAKTPFFLVAGMFGNVLNLRHLAQLIGQDRPFYGLQARGLTGEEPPHTSLVEAATSCIAEMRQVQRQGPWMVGGFSGGGITAFEIARQLRDAGEEVASVILLDTPLPQRRPITRRDRAMIQWLELRSRGLSYPLEWAKRRLAWELAKRKGRDVDHPAEPAFHDAAIEAAFYQGIADYRMEVWDGPLTLFRPPMRGKWQVAPDRLVSHDRDYVIHDNDWGPWATRLQVIEVPGNHDSMVLEPNVRVLAARMRRVIEAAERAPVRQKQWSYKEAAE